MITEYNKVYPGSINKNKTEFVIKINRSRGTS